MELGWNQKRKFRWISLNFILLLSKTKILERTRAGFWFEPVYLFGAVCGIQKVYKAPPGEVFQIFVDVEAQFLRFHVVWELPSQFLISPKPNHKQLGNQCYKHSNEVIPFGEACAKSPIKQKDLNSNYHPEISISPMYLILSKKITDLLARGSVENQLWKKSIALRLFDPLRLPTTSL